MADFIVLRLTPASPIDAATFGNALAGLTVSAFDVSFANPMAGMRGDPTPPIGTATFNPPTFAGLPALAPPPPLATYPAGTTIAQHYAVQVAFGQVVALEMQSIATAVIPYTPPAAEYPGSAPRPDLRLQFQRGGNTILDPDIYYDVPLLVAGGMPATDGYQAIAANAVSAYATLPPVADPTLAGVELSADGSIPNYDDLRAAVDTVLAADPGGGQTLATLVAGAVLTEAQCRNIANEIIWGAEPPLPAPPGAIEPMYTNPPNDGGLSNSNEQNRQQFEGQLTSFYATRAAKVERLTRYVYAIAAAIWCEQRSASATQALIAFPTGTGGTSQATVKQAQVVLTGAVGTEVPAQYFYALGALLPAQITPEQRLRMAAGADPRQTLSHLTTAFDGGALSIPPAAPQPSLNPAQAVRLLAALAIPAGSTTPTCPVADAATVWADYKAYPPDAGWRDYKPVDDAALFWPAEQGSASAAVRSDLLNLNLCALTRGYVIADTTPPVLLADFIRQQLVVHAPGGAVLPAPVGTVAELAQALAGDWVTLFTAAAPPPGASRVDLLPPFTAPGTFDARVQAFIRQVRKVFDLQAPGAATITPPTDAWPTLPLPTAIDPIESFVVAYEALAGGPFGFGGALVPATVAGAAADVFPGDPSAQAWLVERAEALNAVCALASVPGGAPTLKPSLPFAVAEALYARGFTGAAAVSALSASEFQDALRGTVAWDQAAAIHAKALTLGMAPPPAQETPGPFGPVNPGDLVNCHPPCHLSPLGPVQYLHELLQLSEASRCEAPFAAPAEGHPTLGSVIAERRGPLGTLHATAANMDVPLPLIDIVNECLEAMCATAQVSPHGVVHDTAEEELAGLELCATDACCHDGNRDAPEPAACHDPATLLGALPAQSTPAAPIAADAAIVPAAYDALKADFSSCRLPYSQPLDIMRTYLRDACASRFETMRNFRRCITEFALAPAQQPDGFGDHLWRYPVRIDIAIEYLCITPEEYVTVFGGQWLPACGDAAPVKGGGQPPRDGGQQPAAAPDRPAILARMLLARAQPAAQGRRGVPLPAFLEATCLDYCAFLDLWKSGFLLFRNGADLQEGAFPPCEPCCPQDLSIALPDGEDATRALERLLVFIRLWHKLRDGCGRGYSFSELADICTVLPLFSGGAANPDFVRQFAAFQMLRDDFELPLVDRRHPSVPGATGADRAHLLALWAGPAAAKWDWAVETLLQGVLRHARRRFGCEPLPEKISLLRDTLDPLARLAGFDPGSASESWHAAPTHTLRFAEILAKIAASDFSVGEILFLFTAGPHLDGNDPFPLQPDNEALDRPLDLPDDEETFSLTALRRKLIDVHVDEEQASAWGWGRIAHALDRLGFAVEDVDALAAHVFPDAVEAAGRMFTPAERRYATPLAASGTAPLMWNSPPQTPLRYDAGTQTLWTRLPLTDAAVIDQLMHLRPLTLPEQAAVQDLYFTPRRTLAPFALLFEDFAAAQHHLIERGEEHGFPWFQCRFATFHRRIELIAEHLSEHVRAATGRDHPHGSAAAMLVLRNLFADENFAAADWENDAGHGPSLTWPAPAGGALAALLGLLGTGLVMELRRPGGPLLWRDMSGPLHAFGRDRNWRDVPLPTVIPSLAATLPNEELAFVNVLNGMVLRDADGAPLGGAESFEATWTGALLVDAPGVYEFAAGMPAEHGSPPHRDDCDHQRWRVTLKRGQQAWLLLKHRWHDDARDAVSSLPLRRGVYEIRIDFAQHHPAFRNEEDARPRRTGFQLKYAGPDTDGRLTTMPHDRLFRPAKDERLDAGVTGLATTAQDYLAARYTSTLRDIRRTYQRAFKALLFVHRFGLSAKRAKDGRSELGYMLAQKSLFAGRGFYPTGGAYGTNAADFDFNLLPLLDDYLPPSSVADARAAPAPKRRQALFDWWERSFDYVRVREDVARRSERTLWLLFNEAEAKQPANAAYLLRHMGADARHWYADTHYFQSQGAPLYALAYPDLEDDRWVVRAWHADRWMRRLRRDVSIHDLGDVRPALWASDDPALAVPGTSPDGQPIPTGLASLQRFVVANYVGDAAPRRYDALKRVNDCLRLRGRDAMLAYLCAPGRTPLPWGGFAGTPGDLGSLLLIDVEAGPNEYASRIEEAVRAVQAFVRRARLGIEPGWTVGQAFALLWDRQFATFGVWEACKCREVYRENWIEWDAQAASQKIESFRFLQAQLRRATLTAPLPGGLEYWPGDRPPLRPGPPLLQERVPSALAPIQPAREGLGLLGTPGWDARSSWLAAVDMSAPRRGNGSGDEGGQPGIAAIPTPPAPSFGGDGGALPLWIEAAIGLGVRFWRIAAGGAPEAVALFQPHPGGAGCRCAECGRSHPPQVDEYYFWLTDARFFRAVDETDSASFFAGQQDDLYDGTIQDAAPWHDPLERAKLLDWHASPMARLAWCRVHDGRFQPPRRSIKGVEVNPAASPDLAFVGRAADSLWFSVSGGIAPAGHAGGDLPGFRYDLATDEVIVLPLVADPATSPPNPFPAGLPAYPYFVYADPGAPLFPGPLFSPALAIACALRNRCNHEAALKWYALVFDPLHGDNQWMRCVEPDGQGPGAVAVPPQRAHGACCDTTDITDAVAQRRAVLLHVLETMLDWSDLLLRRGAPEAFEQSRVLLDTVTMGLGPTPPTVRTQPPPTTQTVASFTPLAPPLNPRLLEIYGRAEDRLSLIRHRLSARRLREGRPNRDLPFWGRDACCGCHALPSGCADGCGCDCHEDACLPQSPYRFLFLLQKAQELAGMVREFGALLLAAFEKGDAEHLAALRAGQEREILGLNRAVRQNQWRDADWQRQALETSKAVAQTNRRHYAALIQNGLNNGEHRYEDLTGVSLGTHVAANVVDGVAEIMDLIPDLFVGFPCTETWLPIGTKLSGMFKTIARITHAVGDISAQTAGLDLTQSGWSRREQEWVHQVEVLDLEIQHIERQILGTERRQDMALRELDAHQRQIENAQAVLDFLRDKFTSHDLYLHLQRELTGFHLQAFELADHAARQAERAFNFERGDTARRFLPCEPWDDLREGLLAGERLVLALRGMEQSYLDLNVREYELAKHFSLRLHFPIQFMQLKASGACEIELPEWMFDLDHPGQFMRRIRNVTLTIPAVTGPFSGVHARLTLLSSQVRVDPRPSRPPHACCGDCRCDNDYEPCGCDPRIVKHFGAREAIATSAGQSDGGLFELNFRDERYLPFEYHGAVSRWRLELPPENNFFDFDALGDVILNFNYTAREGGDLLRRAANEVAQCRMRRGWSLFDVRHEFPDAWRQLNTAAPDCEGDARLMLRLSRRMFPYIPCHRELRITHVALLFETRPSRAQACCRGAFACCGDGHHGGEACRSPGGHRRDCEAPCCCACIRASQLVEMTPFEDGCPCDEVALRCIASNDHPGLYHGVAPIALMPLEEHCPAELILKFPDTATPVTRAYVMCRYEVEAPPCGDRFVARPFAPAHAGRDRRG